MGERWEKEKRSTQTKVQAVVKICTKQINLHNTHTAREIEKERGIDRDSTRVWWEETKTVLKMCNA